MHGHTEGCRSSRRIIMDAPKVEEVSKREEQRSQILSGRVAVLDTLPPVSSKTVRVFISSTFSDMVVERNALLENVYPRLKSLCRNYGLEFQYVDMRWGVREEAQNDHLTSSLCMKEIYRCQHISIGPTCVVLFGQKYGYRPFPEAIGEDEFEVLRGALTDDNDVALLDRWFSKDLNSCPPVYSLIPISSIFPNFVNKENLDLQEEDRARWWTTFQDLQQLLRSSADLCWRQGKLQQDARDKYFISVTEDEARNGVTLDPVPGRQVCVARTITDLEDHLNHPDTKKFIDLKADGTVDQEAQGLLKVMKETIMTHPNTAGNCSELIANWSNVGGINEQDHKDYIGKLCDNIFNALSSQITNSIEKAQEFYQNSQLVEVIQHLKMCQVRNSSFHGRSIFLETIRNYIVNNSNQALVIHGESGSGKTSIMAVVMQSIPQWLPHAHPVVVARFLGTTPKSSGIVTLLQCICAQIATNYGVTLRDLPEDFLPLTNHFLELLKLATEEKPLVIVLDALDQLSANNHPHRLTWFPWDLPPHVHLIVSTLPDEHQLLRRLKQVVLAPENFIEVPALGKEEGFELLMKWLGDINRSLTHHQVEVVKEALTVCSLPLYTKLVFEEVRWWKSWTPPETTQLSDTVKGIINRLFDRIEDLHGKKLVTYSMAYLTASRSGLTEAEIMDVLSLDDVVLDEVFTFWIPPIRRLPPLLWTRIREDLACYLVEREADGVTVLSWYHKQFYTAMRERYLADRAFRLQVHSSLADYFMGKWGGGEKKPFRYSEKLSKRMTLKCRNSEADRKCPTQPLKWRSRSTKGVEQVRYNLRKLSELPYHLYKSERYRELWKETFYNYKWLHTKLKATSLADVLADAAMVKKTQKAHKVEILVSALRLAGNSLRSLPDTLAAEILGRLKPCMNQFYFVETLVNQCRSEGLKHCSLLPAFQCFGMPVEALLFTMEGHRKQVSSITFSKSNEMLYSVSSDGLVCAWDVKTGNMVYNLNTVLSYPGPRSELYTDSCGHLILENYTERSPLVVFDAETSNFKHKVTSRHGFSHNTVVGCKSALREGQVIDLEAGKVKKVIKCLSNNSNFVAVAMAPNEQHILIGQKEATILVHVETGDIVRSFLNSNIPSKIVITDDSHLAVVGYTPSCVVKLLDIDVCVSDFSRCVWEFDYKSAFPRVKFPSGDQYCQEVSELKLSPDNSAILVNIKRCNLFVVAMETGHPIMLDLKVFGGHEFIIRNASFSPDGFYAMATVGNNLCIWNAATGQLCTHMRLSGTDEDTFLMAVSPTSKYVATVSSQETGIKLWDLAKLQEAQSTSMHVYNNPVDVVAIVPQQKIIFVKTYRRLNSRKGYFYLDYFGVDVWNLATNNHAMYLPFAKYGRLIQMQTTIDGRYIVFLTEMQMTSNVFVLDLAEAKLASFLHQTGCTKVHISQDAQYLLTETLQVKLWAVPSAECLQTFSNSTSAVFTIDSKHLLFIQEKKRVIAYNIHKTKTMSINIKRFEPSSLATVPNIPHVVMVTGQVCGGAGRRTTHVELWDFEKQQRLSSLEAVGANGILDTSKDGCLAVDGYLQVFNLQTGHVEVHGNKLVTGEIATGLVKMTDDGHYVVWADHAPTDCIKAMSVHDGGKVVAEVSTHAKVVSLTLADHGYLVVIGCEDGHLLTFRLHNVTQLPGEDFEFENKFPSRLPDVTWTLSSRSYRYASSPDITNNNTRCNSIMELPSPTRKDAGVAHERCFILESDLFRLDPLYQMPSVELADSELPNAGDRVPKMMEFAAEFSQSMDTNQHFHDKTCTVL